MLSAKISSKSNFKSFDVVVGVGSHSHLAIGSNNYYYKTLWLLSEPFCGRSGYSSSISDKHSWK